MSSNAETSTSHSIDAKRTFPLTCPACEAAAGMPCGAQIGITHGSVVVNLLCGQCCHQWVALLPGLQPHMRTAAAKPSLSLTR